MLSLRKHIFNSKSVSWAVLVAIVMLSIFPMHMHLHDDEVLSASNVSVPHSDKHISSIHAVSDTTGHEGHEHVATMSATPDTLVKKVNLNTLYPAVLVVFFVFLSLALLPQKFRPHPRLHIRKFYIGISPPLRAPPLL